MRTSLVAATEAAAATKAAVTTKGGGATEGVVATAVAWRSPGSLRRECFFFLQIHFLRSILLRHHTDQIPDGIPAKVPADQES